MASEKVSRKMVLEIKYVNANNAVIHTENLVTGILAKISLGTGIWAKFRLGSGIWYPPSRPSYMSPLQLQLYVLTIIRVTLRRIQKPLGKSTFYTFK